MDVTVLSSLAIVGVAVSLLVQWLKQTFGSGIKSQFIAVGLSIFGGLVYFFFRNHTSLWQNCLTVLASADLVYSYILQYIEKPNLPAGSGGA